RPDPRRTPSRTYPGGDRGPARADADGARNEAIARGAEPPTQVESRVDRPTRAEGDAAARSRSGGSGGAGSRGGSWRRERRKRNAAITRGDRGASFER